MRNTKKIEQNAQKYVKSFEYYAFPEKFPIHLAANAKLAAGPISGLHFHDCLEIGICLKGSGVAVISGEFFSFTSGDVTMIPQGVAHYHASNHKTGSEWSWIIAKPAELLACFTESLALLDLEKLLSSPASCFFRAGEDHSIAEVTKSLINQIEIKDPIASVGIRSTLALLMVAVHRCRKNANARPLDRSFTHSSPQLERIAPALNLIAASREHHPSVEELAKACCMGIRNFQYLFTKLLGKTPWEYAVRYYLAMASAQLRTTSQKVIDIAYDNGFKNASSFNRLFKKYMGTTPRSCRTKQNSD